jgi:4-alpha-glucanotransferase
LTAILGADYSNAGSPFASRRAGVLLHVASLPGESPTGTLGAAARRFIDLLAAAGFSVWQMLPVGPGDSPYGSRSTHAGDPRLLDRDRAWPGDAADETALAAFCAAQSGWLDDFALFTALGEAHGGSEWWQWPRPLRDRQPAALAQATRAHASLMERVRLEQYEFQRQWQALRDHARLRGVLLFGDLPVFVAADSADVWAHREFFRLGSDGRPQVVAGVPPDYFSAEGQRWGNPLYDWDRLRADGFGWWIERVRTHLARFDLLRIDHFRGLQAFWEIPGDASSARHGRWVEAPGGALFEAIRSALGDGRLVAEDLGTITPDVIALREAFAIPGMLVLQFAFDGGPDNPYLPHNHVPRAVVYTGTHDNDTTAGWWRTLDREARQCVSAYFGREDPPMPETLIRAAYASVARLAIVPLQDLLGLGSGARLNTPGTAEGNWGWRFAWGDVPGELAGAQRRLLDLYGRLPRAGAVAGG